MPLDLGMTCTNLATLNAALSVPIQSVQDSETNGECIYLGNIISVKVTSLHCATVPRG